MSERKVLNKYYPIDFDTYKLPKLKIPKDRQYVVRLMSPFTMRCLTCGEYIYHGRKFNARKETVQNENYLGIPIHRFYIRCTRCLSEITFKTDPKNVDYVAEHGAVRTFQAHKVLEQQEEEKKREKEEQEANDPMLALENRTRDSRREMDVLDALEDIKDQNARFEQVDLNELLKKYEDEEKRQLELQEQEDEALVKSIFRQEETVKRLKDNEDESGISSCQQQQLRASAGTKRPPTNLLVEEEVTNTEEKSSSEVKRGKSSKAMLLGIVRRGTKSKTVMSQESDSENPATPAVVSRTGEEDHKQKSMKECDVIKTKESSGLGLLGSYSDSDSD